MKNFAGSVKKKQSLRDLNERKKEREKEEKKKTIIIIIIIGYMT